MKPLLVVKTGSTIRANIATRGDFEGWFLTGMGVDPSLARVVNVHRGEALPAPEEVRGVLVTGSPAMVSSRAEWSEKTAAWLRGVVELELPVLGVCFGHQLLAHALGGIVGDCPGGAEVGTVEAALTAGGLEDPLFHGISSRFPVQTSHWESVLELPPGARRLATTLVDPNHAFVVGERAWGVQFHPEFDALIMEGYIKMRREKLIATGKDPDALLAHVSETPEGALVLPRFQDLINGARL